MTVTMKKMRKYEEEKENYLIVKVSGGYNVTNTGTMRMYKVTKDINGKVECSCPDWIHRGSKTNTACKHLIAVRKSYDNKKQAEIEKIIARW